jgi:hypothetical protein
VCGAILHSGTPAADRVKPNSSYYSADELAKAINDAGTPCGLRHARGQLPGRDEQFKCELHSRDSLFITVYTNPPDRLKEVEDAESHGLHAPGGMLLVGPNWTIVGPAAVIERLETTLGGQKIIPAGQSSQAPASETTAKPSNDTPQPSALPDTTLRSDDNPANLEAKQGQV